MSWWSFKPYVSVAQRQAKAAREVAKLKKKGRTITPVKIEGRMIARTFWGKAWCDNLESYSDYANRLPRGRSYVRNGSVCDLQIEPGRVTALVCGSELYKITIAIKPVAPKCWDAIKRQCAGQIGSLIELLQGKLSNAVMQIITRRDGGLFPKPAEIELDCSCPDWADMCKHVAAVLYGVGARLDHEPELLFALRQVDHLDLITQAGDMSAITRTSTDRKTIAGDALADVFGVELEQAHEPRRRSAPAPAETGAKAGRRKIGRATSDDRSRDAKSRPSAKAQAAHGAREKAARPAGAASPTARRKRPTARAAGG